MVYNLKYMFLMSYMTATYSNYFQNLRKREKNHPDLVLGQGQDLVQNTVIKQ